jgi:hypothetical protein
MSVTGAGLTENLKNYWEHNNDVWIHLVLTCTKSAFNLITALKVYKNIFEAWEALSNAKWNKSYIDALVDMNQAFWDCKLGSDTEDPSQRIDKLKLINKRLSKIGSQCTKN